MIDRVTPTQRPAGRSTGRQLWHELSFLHWRIPAEELRPLVPAELTIDEFDGSAWVAIVPFRMTGVRPWWSPALPGISSFAETNVRTYVHLGGRDPGVWFFSLEASNRLAVWIARTFWHLNYYVARMAVTRRGDRIRYQTRRLHSHESAPGGDQQIAIGPPIAQHGPGGRGTAEEGTLEHFLAERYVLYTMDRSGRLLRGHVHHTAYPLRTASCIDIVDTLLPAAGLDVRHRPPDHVLFSEGVQVRIFPLTRASHKDWPTS